ncbi:hypothetical protein Syun_017011 [Stephania yunnanensis]|uniref:Uncharacterized protein n=1 Tax=Stephania yunnanensis TaxID=152371 RepID=A0AAP0P2Y8_9MAGN
MDTYHVPKHGEERSGEHKVVVVANESSSERTAAAADDSAWLCRGSWTAAPAKLDSGQVNDSGARISWTRETRTNRVGDVEFTDQAAAERVAEASTWTTGRWRSGAAVQ